MSEHKIPLTDLEKSGLERHGLPIGKSSQLSDAFRHGVKWAESELTAAKAEIERYKRNDQSRLEMMNGPWLLRKQAEALIEFSFTYGPETEIRNKAQSYAQRLLAEAAEKGGDDE